MGDKTQWDMAAHAVVKKLSDEWSVISIDLPAHGDSPLLFTADEQIIQGILCTILSTVHPMSIQNEHKITNLDAIAEYIMGGRVAMAMMKFDASDHAILCQDILYNSKRFLTSRCYYLILTPGVFILMIRWLALMLTGRGKRPMTNYK
jgi:hypothetical protein